MWQQQKHRRQKGEKWKHTLSDPYIIHEVLEHYLKTERKPKIHNTKPRPTTQNLLNNQKKKKSKKGGRKKQRTDGTNGIRISGWLKPNYINAHIKCKWSKHSNSKADIVRHSFKNSAKWDKFKKKKKPDNSKYRQKYGAARILIYCQWEVAPLWKTAWQYRLKLNICMPRNPAILLSRNAYICSPKHVKKQKKAYNSTCVIAKTWRVFISSSTLDWINCGTFTQWNIIRQQQKKTKQLPYATTWVNLTK